MRVERCSSTVLLSALLLCTHVPQCDAFMGRLWPSPKSPGPARPVSPAPERVVNTPSPPWGPRPRQPIGSGNLRYEIPPSRAQVRVEKLEKHLDELRKTADHYQTYSESELNRHRLMKHGVVADIPVFPAHPDPAALIPPERPSKPRASVRAFFGINRGQRAQAKQAYAEQREAFDKSWEAHKVAVAARETALRHEQKLLEAHELRGSQLVTSPRTARSAQLKELHKQVGDSHASSIEILSDTHTRLSEASQGHLIYNAKDRADKLAQIHGLLQERIQERQAQLDKARAALQPPPAAAQPLQRTNSL